MKKIITIFLLALAFFIIGCSNHNNPIWQYALERDIENDKLYVDILFKNEIIEKQAQIIDSFMMLYGTTRKSNSFEIDPIIYSKYYPE